MTLRVRPWPRGLLLLAVACFGALMLSQSPLAAAPAHVAGQAATQAPLIAGIRIEFILFALVLLGVMGGVIAFGFIGLFIGPTLLAVGYCLIDEWSSHAVAAAPAANVPAAAAAMDSKEPADE